MKKILLCIFILSFLFENFSKAQCPTAYTVSGGGSYCSGSTGPTISIPNSQTGINYNLIQVGTQGVTAQYYNNMGVTGTPVVTEVDPNINYDYIGGNSFGGNPRPSGVNSNQFSIRYSGFIYAPVSGSYTFTTNSDDGIRLWVNGSQIISDWNDHAPTTDNGTITLTAGQYYPFVMEFYQNGGGAIDYFYWTYPGQAKIIIPSTAFFQASTVATLSGTTGNALNFTNVTVSGSTGIFSVIGATTSSTFCNYINSTTPQIPMSGTVTVTKGSITTSNAGPTQNLCNISSATLAGNNPSIGTGTWTQNSGPNSATITSPSSYNSGITGLVSGTYVFQWTISSGTCPSSSSTVTINNYAPPTTAIAGSNQNLCNVSSTSLAGNNPGVGTGTWSLVSGPNIPGITNPSAYNTGITGMSPGTYVFQWSISNGTCTTSSSTVSIINSASPTSSNAGPTQNLCNITTATLAGNIPVIGTGAWTWVSGPNTPTITSPTAYNSGLTGMTTGSYIFAWTITNGACSSSSQVTLINNPLPSNSNAGTNQSLCNVTSTSLSGNNPGTGSGTWTQINGPNTAVITSPSSYNTSITGLMNGTYTFQWSISSGTCSASTSSVTIIIGSTPIAYNVTGGGNYCSTGTGSTINLSGSQITSTYQLVPQGLYAQYFNNITLTAPVIATAIDSTVNHVNGSGGFGPAGVPNYNYSTRWTGFVIAPVSGNYIFTVVGDDGIRLSLNGTQIINGWVVQGPTPYNSAPIPLVAGQAYPILLEFYQVGGGTAAQLEWSYPGQATQIIPSAQFYETISGTTSVAGTGSALNFTNITSPGNYKVLGTDNNSGCSGWMNGSVNVSVSNPPTLANAGSNQNLCNVSSISLAGNNPTMGTGLWSWVSGPNTPTITTPSAYNSGITGLVPGTYVFQWTISSGSCTASTSTVSILISPSPTTSNAGTSQNLCNVTSTTLAGNNPLAGTGTWTQLSGPNTATITNSSLNNTTVTGMTQGTYTFQWTISSGTCTSSTSTVSITISPTPSLSMAGANQNLCNISTTTLAGNSPSVGTGTWSQINGPNIATLSNANLYNTTVTGMINGTYTFQWTISSGSCTASTSTVSILISPSPTTSNAGTSQNLCNVTSTTLAGNNPLAGTGTWTQLSGPNTATITKSSLNNTTVTGMTQGTYTFQWTISSGACTSSTSTVSIAIAPTPTTSDAGTTQNLCNVTSTTLAGNNPSVGTGTWTQLSGPNTATITNSSLNNTTVTGMTQGTYTFQWTISSGACTTSTSTVSIIIAPNPTTSNAGISQNLCNVSSTILAGNNPIAGTGTWTQLSGPNTATITNSSLNHTTVTGMTQGTYTFQWTISSGACTSSTSTVSIAIAPTPTTSDAGTTQNLCNVTSTTLAGNNPSAGTGIWTQLSGPNTASITNSSLYNSTVNGLTNGTYTFQWTISSGVCTSSTSTVSIVISPTPTISDGGASQNLCNVSSTTLAGNNPSAGTGTWSQISGPNSAKITDSSLYNSTITGMTSGTYTFGWTITSGICNSSQSSVSITIYPSPSLSNAGPNQKLSCSSSSTTLLNGNAPINGTGIWTQASGPNTANISNSALFNSPLGNLIPGIYVFTWTINSGVCTSSSSSVTIQVPTTLTAVVDTQVNVLCYGASTGSAHLLVSGGTPPYHISWSGLPSQNSSYVVGLAAGNYTFSVTDSSSCFTSGMITISQLPALILKINNPVAVIAPFTVDLTASTITSGSTAGLTFNYFLDSAATNPLANPGKISVSGKYYIQGTNSNGCSTISPVWVTINSAALPVPVKDSITTLSGQNITAYLILGNDLPGTYSLDPASVDLDPLTAGIQNALSLPGKGTFTVSTIGGLTFVPVANFSGIVQANYTLADIYGNRSIVNAPILVYVYPVANASLSITDSANKSIKINVLKGSLGNLDSTKVSIVTGPSHGKLIVNPSTGLITYTPNFGYTGSDNFTYFVCDKTQPVSLCSSQASVNISISAPLADLQVVINGPASQNDGNPIPYNITLTNNGPNTAHNVILTNSYPTSLSISNISTTAGTYVLSSSSYTLVLNVDSILSGETITITYSAVSSLLGTIKNSVTVLGKESDPVLANNTSSINTDYELLDLTVKNLFTPTGSSNNDRFVIKGLEFYPNNSIEIFNRWGNQVYQAQSYGSGGNWWDGSQLNDGTYYYILKLQVNGSPMVKAGYITILRKANHN